MDEGEELVKFINANKIQNRWDWAWKQESADRVFLILASTCHSRCFCKTIFIYIFIKK